MKASELSLGDVLAVVALVAGLVCAAHALVTRGAWGDALLHLTAAAVVAGLLQTR